MFSGIILSVCPEERFPKYMCRELFFSFMVSAEKIDFSPTLKSYLISQICKGHKYVQT